MAIFRCKLVAILIATAACAAGPDWQALTPEIVEKFSGLLRIDTRNPPGNETRAAEYLKGILEREGIAARLFAKDPNRANLVARIRGTGAKRPILVMGHTDVVGVQAEKWTVDPFAAIRKNGYIYGRGAQDDKDNTIAGLMLMLLLQREKVKLDRDVIFLAEAGEEGSSGVGIDYMADQHWSEIEAEYALAEGGAAVARKGKVRYVAITTTEKVPRGVRLIARGTAGHGSRPSPDNAVLHLAAAVARFVSWQPPMRLNDTTQAYFERLATISPPEQADRYKHITDVSRAAEIDQYFATHEPAHYSMLRTSIVPTIIKGGFRANVIPSDAEAYLDVRTLPDEDMDGLLKQMRAVIADPAVEVAPTSRGRPAAPPSRLDTEMFQALERTQKRMYPDAITLPSMLTGATDMAQLRARGVQAYGFGPVEEEGAAGGAHADDERISTRSLAGLVEFLWNVVLDAGGTR